MEQLGQDVGRKYIYPSGLMTKSEWERSQREKSTGRPVTPASIETANQVFGNPELVGLMGKHAAAAYHEFDTGVHYTGFHIEELDFRLVSTAFVRAWNEAYDAEHKCLLRWPSLRLGHPWCEKRSWLSLQTQLRLAERSADDDMWEQDDSEDGSEAEVAGGSGFTLQDFHVHVHAEDGHGNLLFAASRQLSGELANQGSHPRMGPPWVHGDDHGGVNLGFGEPFLSIRRGGARLSLSEKIELSAAPRVFPEDAYFDIEAIFGRDDEPEHTGRFPRTTAFVHRSDGSVACLLCQQPPSSEQRRNDAAPFSVSYDLPFAQVGRFCMLDFGITDVHDVHPPNPGPCVSVRQTAHNDWHPKMQPSWDAMVKEQSARWAAFTGQKEEEIVLGGGQHFTFWDASLAVWVNEDSPWGDDEPTESDVLKALDALHWIGPECKGLGWG